MHHLGLSRDAEASAAPDPHAMSRSPFSSPTRRRAVAALALAGLLATAGPAAAQPASGEPILIGVSGPLTGPNAQYGAQWKLGFDLALDAINGQGGIKGRPLQYVFEDSQSDPRQSVSIAQKFVSNPKIVMEFGDFSSPASMAASPIYQRGKLVQFGFTNSHPDFTKGGDYMWSNSIPQDDQQPLLAEYASKLGLKKVALLHLNTDWGRTSKDLFLKAAAKYGLEVVATEGYLPDEKDYRSTLVRARDANPDGLVLISYYADAALIAKQVKAAGLKQPLVGVSSVYSPKLLELGGEAVNGMFAQSNFFPEDDRPEVKEFVAKYRAKYSNSDPDSFSTYAYDTMILASEVMKQYGTERTAIQAGLSKIRDVPSVLFGKASFDPQTRRVSGAKNVDLVVRDGKFAIWDGVKPGLTR